MAIFDLDGTERKVKIAKTIDFFHLPKQLFWFGRIWFGENTNYYYFVILCVIIIDIIIIIY